jgi:hypothetical protein
MEAKLFLMFALLAPALMVAAGIFAHRENADEETANRRWAGDWWPHKDSNLGPAD